MKSAHTSELVDRIARPSNRSMVATSKPLAGRIVLDLHHDLHVSAGRRRRTRNLRPVAQAD